MNAASYDPLPILSSGASSLAGQDCVGDWARALYGDAVLPDERLRERLADVTQAIACAPGSSIPLACCDWTRTKGAYRLIENRRMKPEFLHDAFSLHTRERCAELDLVLAVQDTTTATFPKTYHAEGLGRVNASPSRGVLLHTTLAVAPDGVALGLLGAHSWSRHDDGLRARDRANLPIERKESIRWLNAAQAAHDALAALPVQSRPRLCHVTDREGDIHEFLDLIVGLGDMGVVRCARDRRIQTHEAEDSRIALAHASVAQSRCRGVLLVTVPRGEKRPARTATVEVRWQPQTLHPSKAAPLQRSRGPVALWLLEAREVDAPAGVDPLHWRLWTTEALETLADAQRILDIYRWRWRIEDYHRVLKDGLKVEDLRLETADRLRLALALCAPVAARIVEMRDRSRLHPDAPCTVLFSELEWQVLWISQNRERPVQTPTIGEAVRLLGRLGGHLGRKGDGMPGVKTLWRGTAILGCLTAYELVRGGQTPAGSGSAPNHTALLEAAKTLDFFQD
jgi:hypothetical protein